MTCVGKIDIERVCWELLGVKFSYFTGNELTRAQSKNIDWATSPFRKSEPVFSHYQIDYVLSSMKLGMNSVEELCNRLISQNIVSNSDALLIIRYLIADKYIDVDLSFNIPESGILDVKRIAEAQGDIASGNF
ncbi:TnsA endonuclease C-terminal domain-containing protein [Psychromonas sp. B3M02]|uniref:TnsA endonuclease C-terminal domain-containing protein n=1 Tax=Psychromonas sp. B3M02 TaxID=2267226 RepID=UPI001C69309D|nr:TnsA endonuclease C-terminal domain-containing protein [Psychromonas sp. B3M02]